MEQISGGDIQSLSNQQLRLERAAVDLRIEREKREKEEMARHNVAMGEVKRWYNGELKALNDGIAELNKASQGLMPVHPRR